MPNMMVSPQPTRKPGSKAPPGGGMQVGGAGQPQIHSRPGTLPAGGNMNIQVPGGGSGNVNTQPGGGNLLVSGAGGPVRQTMPGGGGNNMIVSPGGPPPGGSPVVSSGPYPAGPQNPMTFSPGGPQPGDPFGPTSAMDVYRSSAPVMQQEMVDRINEAMAASGVTGNRFSSSAQRAAAREGSRAGLHQNQLMANLLSGQTNQDLDRAMRATDQAMNWEQINDQLAQNRLLLPFQMGQWETGRQDIFSQQMLNQFNQDRMGWLPMMLQAAMSPGTATQGQFGTQTTAGSPGAIDYFSALAPYFMMAFGG